MNGQARLMARYSGMVTDWLESPWPAARVAQVAGGGAAGLAIVYLALRLYDQTRASEANFLVAIAIIAGVVLLRLPGYRELGIGLLTPLVLSLIAAVLIAFLSAFIALS